MWLESGEIGNSMERNCTCPKKHELKLYNNPNKKCYICNGCKEYGSNGMRYRCEDCDYDLHKDCMFIKPTTTHEIFKDLVFKFFNQPPVRNSTAKEPRDIVMLVGNMSKVSTTIALKRTWICTPIVSTSSKNSKLIMWNFTMVGLSQSAYFAIKLICWELIFWLWRIWGCLFNVDWNETVGG